MSGPKVITYNMNAFKGSLREFMRLQSRLLQMQREIQKAAIHDHKLNIHFDCSESYRKIAPEIEKALVAMVFDYQGNIEKKTYDEIERQITTRTKELNKVLKQSEDILSDFHAREKDHKSYINYHSFIENAKTAFGKFKQELDENTAQNFSTDFPELTAEALKKYGTIQIEEQIKAFNWGFDKIADTVKKEIFDHVTDKENQIRELRKEMLDKIIATGTINKTPIEKVKVLEKPNPEIERVSKKIKEIISHCNQKVLVNEYTSRFEKLKLSKSMNDLFFYQELHDSLLEKESSRKNKEQINELLVLLNTLSIEHSLSLQKQELVQKAVNLINNTRVTGKETNMLSKEIRDFSIANSRMKEDKELKKKEQLFVKSQIILNFENLGYQVMDDLEVIDFEKENDFYLQAPGQENLLNIKFRDDGSFRYVFQIPQNKEALSTEEQKMKLHEMKSTCDDFVNVLNDLKTMGVDIDIKSDKPIELASMVTIPETLNNKLKTRKQQTHKKQQIKKLYLG